MPEPFDVHADATQFILDPYGALMRFSKIAVTEPGTKLIRYEHVGVVRMSLEQLRTTVYLIKRGLDETNSSPMAVGSVPVHLLNELGIAPEDWDGFWRLGVK